MSSRCIPYASISKFIFSRLYWHNLLLYSYLDRKTHQLLQHRQHKVVALGVNRDGCYAMYMPYGKSKTLKMSQVLLHPLIWIKETRDQILYNYMWPKQRLPCSFHIVSLRKKIKATQGSFKLIIFSLLVSCCYIHLFTQRCHVSCIRQYIKKAYIIFYSFYNRKYII